MSEYLKLLNNFETLGLMNMREYYPELLDSYHNENKTLTSILIDLTDNELHFKQRRSRIVL